MVKNVHFYILYEMLVLDTNIYWTSWYLQLLPSMLSLTAHKDFTITPNVNYKCPGSVAAIALPVAAIALPQPPIYLKLTWKKLASQMA